jgi:hypothetical protein
MGVWQVLPSLIGKGLQNLPFPHTSGVLSPQHTPLKLGKSLI